MNYIKIYDALINSCKEKIQDEYTENHHIIPKCVGGNNKKNNLVKLSYREHFLAHWLLCKIYPDNFKIKASFAKMLGTSNNKTTSSYMYDAVKRNLKDIHFPWLKNRIPWNKGKTGVQVPWNKGLTFTPMEEKTKIQISKTLKKLYTTKKHPRKGLDPWNKGKTGVQVPWNKNKKTEKTVCEYCQVIVDKLNYAKWHGNKCKHAADRLMRVA